MKLELKKMLNSLNPLALLHSINSPGYGSAFIDMMSVMSEGRLRSISHYSEQAVPFLSEEDFIILPHNFDRDYFDYINELGINHPQFKNILSVGESPNKTLLKYLIDDKQKWQSVLDSLPGDFLMVPWFFCGEETNLKSVNLDNVLGYDTAITTNYELDDKFRFKRICEEEEIPHAPYIITDKYPEISDFFEKNGKDIVIKISHSSCGHGFKRVNNRDDIPLNLDYDVMVEPFFHLNNSPCVQAVVSTKGEVKVLGVLDQILMADFSHFGNNYPSQYPDKNKLEDYTTRLGKKLAEKSFRGFFGVDFIETDDNALYASEINPRFNGSAYALLTFLSNDTLNENCSNMFFFNYHQIKFGETFTSFKDKLGKDVFDGHKGLLVTSPYLIDKGFLTGMFIGNDTEENIGLFNKIKYDFERK